MGFFTEATYFDFPHKRMVDDLLERNGPPTKESFTPYKGMIDLIAEQGLAHLDMKVIKENIEELPVETSLENIDEPYVANYIRKQLIALKNKEDVLRVNEENEKVQDTMVDPETGEAFLLSDVYVADDSFYGGGDKNGLASYLRGLWD
ncbi:hypothetical protein [Gorillibacterium sp. CAU 1737]|uniref:hypothetical protein n=1 Tax=Gorillibacterium sp. CAU 1737 TaxID=3140362 RepID=UPI003260EB0F